MCKRPYHKGASVINTHFMHTAAKYSLTGMMKLFHIQRHGKEISQWHTHFQSVCAKNGLRKPFSSFIYPYILLKKPCRTIVFTSREAAWSCRTVGQKKKKKETYAFWFFAASLFVLFWAFLQIMIIFIIFDEIIFFYIII